jgi:hypothetical protein
MSSRLAMLAAFAFTQMASVSTSTCLAQTGNGNDNLAGAWQGRVQFTTGVFADTKDLEFMYAFNSGGTMTESSNYDAAPPALSAYGVWRRVGARKYEAKYKFYQSRAVSSADELIKGGGWAPDGYGTLTQKITLSADGNSFDSRITLELFGKDGNVMAGGGEATASRKRLHF